MAEVYYDDDPHQRVFRIVYLVPGEPVSMLDDPRWTTDNVPAGRLARLEKRLARSARKRGAIDTAASEPVVYLVNLGLLTDAQVETLMTFLNANPRWSNFINLGDGNAAALIAAANVISPSWVITVDADLPAFGAPNRQRSAGTHTLRVWQI